MTFDIFKVKSEDNLKAAEHLVDVKCRCYYASASRMYYAVFQRIKYLLLKQGFNYTSFLIKWNMQNPGRVDAGPFSHGTIQQAISEHLEQKHKAGNAEKEKLIAIDELYRIRRLADYEPSVVDSQRIKNNLQTTKGIIDIIDRYDI